MKILPGLAIAALACFVLPIAGCANLGAAINAANSASISPRTAAAAVTAFKGAKSVMTTILVTCTPATRPGACNDVALYAADKAVRAGDVVSDAIQAQVDAHPTVAVDGTIYQKLEASISTINAAITAYNS